ncbi:MAG TPA: hypothetical protein VMQ50_05595 [Casimicrobiaceae bacterium]|nr:hypothetical protein [Casimicrobiaceae bacterium]
MSDLLLILRYPLAIFALTFLGLGLSAWLGATRFQRLRAQAAEDHEDFNVIETATLTLLGLIVGFTFSMALTRYDQRKNLEEEEANAIGTEYVRADFLPAADAAKVRALLLSYLDQRMLFYTTRDQEELNQIDERTAKLQAELWSAVRAPAAAQPTPVMAVVVTGMNDVLNSQGYAQAAWRNRIPGAAWSLMGAIAVCAAMLVGIGARSATAKSRALRMVLPLVVSIAFFLIADIDSPRRGMIRVVPQNLLSLSQSLHGQ